MTGYLLADDPQGETPMIPTEVMEFSIKHSTEVDINTTLQILGSPGEKASSIPGCNRTDSVIRYRDWGQGLGSVNMSASEHHKAIQVMLKTKDSGLGHIVFQMVDVVTFPCL